jgi:[CysO sulfur-carrier protein]-S-L-cysteine hydrolase
MKISADLIDEMVAHAREDLPNECCGIVAADDGRAVKVFKAANAEASPVRYGLDPREQYKIMMEIDREGWTLGGIYHSHTRSPAYPSQTDVNLAANWPDPLYLICSLADPDAPLVRAFSIRDGLIEEAELEADDGSEA